MRKLFLMYGAPASGKSYILNKLRVEDYTIEVDKIRQLYTNPQDYLIENDNGDQMTSGISIVKRIRLKSLHHSLQRTCTIKKFDF